ncbi:MAG TPA: hypothetical protein VKA91_02350 [Nitrososphaeraceae archaeon]|nr:hypothetical protein [Nitrososphaeraceae archaeon]
MPILHFSGKFKNQPPLYNNKPSNVEQPFDDRNPDEVKKSVTERVEPGEYFEFKFHDVFITKVTYDDGTSTKEKENDAVIGKRLILKGLLVDTAPHLLRSRLFAGEFRIIDLLMGKLEEGFESDLFTTIRGDEIRDDKIERPLPYSADFECKIYEMQNLADDFKSRENSRFFSEYDLENSNFKIYFHLSKFYYSKLEGEVHGYIGLHVPELDDHRVRIHGRRLLVDPSIAEELKEDFKIDPYRIESNQVGRYDLEGTYEILTEKRLVVLRYLNFIPYMDSNNTTPSGYTFFVKLLNNGTEIESNLPSEIKVDRENISQSGGICIVKFAGSIEDLSMLTMSVITKKNNEKTQSFMIEPEYDLLIDNYKKYLILESGKKEELKIQLYEKNCPSKNRNIRVILDDYENASSPKVARWTKNEATPNEDCLLTCYVQAHDLENSEEIDDSVILGVNEEEKQIFDEEKKEVLRGKLFGDLPWDRYYGNYISTKIDNKSIRSDNKKEPTIKFNIPVRVLHSVRLDDKLRDAIDNLDKEKIQEVMTKILSYYVRYYPWLHTEYAYTDLPQPAKLAYSRFLDITKFLIYVDKNDIGNWGLLQRSVDGMNHFLDRLTREDNDWKKMPRSRDFPFNGVEFLKMYKASIIDKMISAINEEQDRIIKFIGGSEIKINMDNWRQIQTLLNSLGDMTNRLSSDEDKKLIAIWKLQIYDSLIHDLSHAKAHTKHVHEH